MERTTAHSATLKPSVQKIYERKTPTRKNPNSQIFHVRAILRAEVLQEHFLFGASRTEGDFACAVTQTAHCLEQITVREVTPHPETAVTGN